MGGGTITYTLTIHPGHNGYHEYVQKKTYKFFQKFNSKFVFNENILQLSGTKNQLVLLFGGTKKQLSHHFSGTENQSSLHF